MTTRNATSAEIQHIVGDIPRSDADTIAQCLDFMNDSKGCNFTYSLRRYPNSSYAFDINVSYDSIPEIYRTDMIKQGVTPAKLL